ncbi:NUDIX hydrolase [Streptomyces broussonetiae]|uniref:NUDIX domain-containing protein n=1 Tax=Streptomyces broussonetiae TaxID=2686304 RepID=A0A6I6MVJ2_9ACTN|nr:NUDIX hydrolase [Streptomyces broussonetiae]QHA04748.1 NUDIX domain-containing protein [Streptomyces broussonetiae]
MREHLRVAAYAVCVREEQILLARSPGPGGVPEWVLPGGGMEHGEDPYDTVRREVTEETGYRIRVTGLLGVDSLRLVNHPRVGRHTDLQALRIVYEGEVVDGELRYEVGGSTDFAAWQPLDVVPALVRVPLVDTALRLWRERPVDGRPTPA